MTSDEMETWWMLAGGKTGKRQPSEPTGGAFYWWSRKRRKIDWAETDTDQLIQTVDIAVAENATPRELKKFLATFGTAARMNLAQHPRLDPRLLPVLAKDASPTVREKIAHRIDLPEPIIRLLATDKSSDVRAIVLANPNIAEATINLMFEHGNDRTTGKKANSRTVWQKVLSHPKLSRKYREEALCTFPPGTAAYVFENPGLTAEEIEQYWTKLHTEGHKIPSNMLYYMLEDSRTPVSVLEGFTQESIRQNFIHPYSFDKLQKVFKNNDVSTETATKVIDYAAAGNMRGMPYTKYTWAKIVSHPNITDAQLERIIQYCSVSGAQAATEELSKRGRQS